MFFYKFWKEIMATQSPTEFCNVNSYFFYFFYVCLHTRYLYFARRDLNQSIELYITSLRANLELSRGWKLIF